MARFEVLTGKHREGKTTYQTGEVFESPLDLDKVFPDRLRRVGASNGGPISLVVPAGAPDAEHVAGEAKVTIRRPKAPPEGPGENWTENFKVDSGLFSVFKRGGVFYVHEKDGKVLHKKPLAPEAVETFCSDYLAE